MIIDFDVASHILAEANQNNLTLVITEILRSHRRGYHLVVMPRATATWILDNIILSGIDQATLRKLRSEYAQTAELRSTALIRLRVLPQHMGGPTLSGKVIEFGLTDLISSNVCEKAVIVVEDTGSDGQFYENLFKGIIAKIGNVQIGLEMSNGGGENTSRVFKEKISDRRLVVMIADSDKSAPSFDIPAKISKAKLMAEQAVWPLTEVICLPCREVENLVPLHLVEKLRCSQGRGVEISSLHRIQTAEDKAGIPVHHQLWMYYDLKRGAPEDRSEWLETKLRMGGHASYQGFGNQMMTQFVADEAIKKEFRQYVKKDHWWNTFGIIFERALWMVVAANRQFA
ncbi:hypothetical protein [Phyllobacterium ifriqiyense]|uniref:hypothetical protein n=1 Tax=Phyllobacterium ifriqiyense TaxID=314238 RepID=UPI00339229D7